MYTTTAGSPYVYIGTACFVQYVWEVMICIHCTCILNQCQLYAYGINFSVHPRRLFLSSKCRSMIVLNDGMGFKAIKSQNGEKKASVSCHHLIGIPYCLMISMRHGLIGPKSFYMNVSQKRSFLTVRISCGCQED